MTKENQIRKAYELVEDCMKINPNYDDVKKHLNRNFGWSDEILDEAIDWHKAFNKLESAMYA